MAKKVEGFYEIILECAKKEFLEKGYKDASMRTIQYSHDASARTMEPNYLKGMMYICFEGKEGLFGQIVKPVSEEFMSRFMKAQDTFHGFDSETQRIEVGKYSAEEMLKMVDYMYDHFDEFSLLLDASYGTKFQNFVDKLVSVEEEYTWKWMEATGFCMELEGELTKEFYHTMVTSYFEGIFEVIRHKMCREDAKKYISMMGEYHYAGFQAIVRNKIKYSSPT